MATFGTLNPTTNSTSTDDYLIRQGGIDYKQSREILAAGVANARWDSSATYELGSEIVGSDNNLYVALIESTNINPTTDDGTNWYLVNRTLSPTSVQVITVSGTYTPAATVKAIKVTLVGGGGGGGGADGQGVGTRAQGSGGNSGGACIKLITSLETSYSVVIGAGGSGGLGAVYGTAGGNSTFIGDDTATTNMTANGGNGGTSMVGTSGVIEAHSLYSGSSSGGDINTTGAQGASGMVSSGLVNGLGDSGVSFFGDSRRGFVENPGADGTSFGAAGSGAGVGGDTTDYAGGNGFQGVCIIEEFF